MSEELKWTKTEAMPTTPAEQEAYQMARTQCPLDMLKAQLVPGREVAFTTKNRMGLSKGRITYSNLVWVTVQPEGGGQPINLRARQMVRIS